MGTGGTGGLHERRLCVTLCYSVLLIRMEKRRVLVTGDCILHNLTLCVILCYSVLLIRMEKRGVLVTGEPRRRFWQNWLCAFTWWTTSSILPHHSLSSLILSSCFIKIITLQFFRWWSSTPTQSLKLFWSQKTDRSVDCLTCDNIMVISFVMVLCRKCLWWHTWLLKGTF